LRCRTAGILDCEEAWVANPLDVQMKRRERRENNMSPNFSELEWERENEVAEITRKTGVRHEQEEKKKNYSSLVFCKKSMYNRNKTTARFKSKACRGYE
jgi:hypothetical protein